MSQAQFLEKPIELKDQLVDYATNNLIYRQDRFIFTEHLLLVFNEISIKNNILKPIDKGFFIRQLCKTLRTMDIEEKPIHAPIRIDTARGIATKTFTKHNGFSPKILLNFDWFDPNVSKSCIPGNELLDTFLLKQTRIVKQPSQYLYSEFPHGDILTVKGAEALIDRYVNMNFHEENYNHPKNIFQVGVGTLKHAVDGSKKEDIIIKQNEKIIELLLKKKN
jgi:hypothetical protein